MTNVWYDKGPEKFAGAQINWGIGSGGDTIKAVAVSSAYTFNSGHEFLADIPAPSRLSTTAALTGKSYTLGVLDADDATFPTVTGTIAAAVVIKDTGTASTSPILHYINDATGIGMTGAGTDIDILWPNGGIAVL